MSPIEISQSERFRALLAALSPSFKPINKVPEHLNLTLAEVDDDDEESILIAKLIASTHFFALAGGDGCLGIYEHSNGKPYVIHLHDAMWFEFIGDTLSNWVDSELGQDKAEEKKAFKKACEDEFGIPDHPWHEQDSPDLDV
ncbi:hypothetical protein ACI2KR_08190 [Pseudomonas luteola]